MVTPQIFARGNKEASRAVCRVAHYVSRLLCDHLNHQPDDVARRAKLAVLPRSSDLGEHVLVKVTLSIALLHRHLVDHINDLCQQSWIWNREARVFHVMRVRGLVAT